MTNDAEVRSPVYAQIEPVGQCNLRCQMCPIQFRRDGPPYGPNAFMKFELFTKLIDQLNDLEELHLQGMGEPMMHPLFFEMVRYASERGIRVSTNTNLMLLNPVRAKSCVTSGLRDIYISIDAATPETYERIRVGASFRELLEHLDLLFQKRCQFKTATPRLHCVTVVMRQNLEGLPLIVKLAKRFHLEDIFVQHLSHDFKESDLPEHYRPMRDFVEKETLLHESEARIQRCFNEAQEWATRLNIPIRFPNRRPFNEKTQTLVGKRCDWPWKGPYISYQGFSMPCCMVATPDRMQLGDLSIEDFTTLWNGKAYQSFRRKLSSDRPPEICRGCSIYHQFF